jgi:hypothetical protein
MSTAKRAAKQHLPCGGGGESFPVPSPPLSCSLSFPSARSGRRYGREILAAFLRDGRRKCCNEFHEGFCFSEAHDLEGTLGVLLGSCDGGV